MGSKRKLAPSILGSIQPHLRPGSVIIEPFCGGANFSIQAIDYAPVWAFDNHPYLIALLQAGSAGWQPDIHYTEAQYQAIKSAPELFPPHVVGYVGFCLSYGGKWWGGWRRDSLGKRDYVAEAQRGWQKEYLKLAKIKFALRDYRELAIPSYGIIYADPPYENTTGYANSFDHESFWHWADQQTVPIFVSSYKAPLGWKVLFRKSVSNSLTRNTGATTGIETLFAKNLDGVLNGR